MGAANFLDGLLTPLVLLPATKTIAGSGGLTTDSFLVSQPVITLGGVVNLFSGFYFAPTINYPSAQIVATIPAFWAAPTYAPTAAISDAGSTLFAGFYAQPAYNPTISGARTPTLFGFLSNPTTKPASGTSIVDRMAAFTAFPTLAGVSNVAAGATASIVAGLTVLNPSKAGTIPVLAGVEIANLTSGALNFSVYSTGVTPMGHAGPGVFGAAAVPTNASVGLEVQSTTLALLLPRVTNTAAVVTPVNGMMIYDVALSTPRVFAAGAWRSI